jgi:hypothetical protein
MAREFRTGDRRRRTATSCRSTKISMSFEAPLRASSASHPNNRITSRWARRKSTSAEARSSGRPQASMTPANQALTRWRPSPRPASCCARCAPATVNPALQPGLADSQLSRSTHGWLCTPGLSFPEEIHQRPGSQCHGPTLKSWHHQRGNGKRRPDHGDGRTPGESSRGSRSSGLSRSVVIPIFLIGRWSR